MASVGRVDSQAHSHVLVTLDGQAICATKEVGLQILSSMILKLTNDV